MEIKHSISLFSVCTNISLPHGDTLLCKLVALTSQTKLILTLTLNPKTKATLECGANPSKQLLNPNTTAS